VLCPTLTPEDSATRIARVFGNIGLIHGERMAPIVLVMGHGARTVNNPLFAVSPFRVVTVAYTHNTQHILTSPLGTLHGTPLHALPDRKAYNCGACGGREGGPNARLFAKCANDPLVRRALVKHHGIAIPSTTWFVGAFHDTTSELVELFDTDLEAPVPRSFEKHLDRARSAVHSAQTKSAFERCGKMMLSPRHEHARCCGAFTGAALSEGNCCRNRVQEEALRYVLDRSTDLGEPRPELGHTTTAMVVLGRREITRELFLARRAFLPSYDPWGDDERGTKLQNVLTPAIVVCSGISLEYLFSTVDGGAGTKAAMNVVGNLGVMQGTFGDLLVGLPTQMTELHSPCRIMYLIDAPVARVEAVLSRNKVLLDIVRNGWIRIFVRDPSTGQVLRHDPGGIYTSVDSAEGKRAQGSASVLLDILPTLAFPPSDHELELAYQDQFLPIAHHLVYLRKLVSQEAAFVCLAALGILLSAMLPPFLAEPTDLEFTSDGTVPRRFEEEQIPGFAVALCASALAFCCLGFSRRYLHGEFMFGRFVVLSTLMLLGFNLVVLAPLMSSSFLAGWDLVGYSSVFLIGAYNGRPTARDSALYCMFVFQLSDVFLYGAAGLAERDDELGADLVALCVLLAALLKSSQFPVMNLFARSMEGSTPGSALGDAALAAHSTFAMRRSQMNLVYVVQCL
jgi:hypothetical protein